MMTIVTYSARFLENREKTEQQREMENSKALPWTAQYGRPLNDLHSISAATLWQKHYHLQFRDGEIAPQIHGGLPQELRIRATFELDLSIPQAHVLSTCSTL